MAPGRAGAKRSRQSEKQGGDPVTHAQSGLTEREIDVLRLLSRGFTYSEIGKQLGISLHTVTSHIKKSYRKLGAHSAAEAVTRAAELQLLDRVTTG
jgi:DNA-binding CsgD family transcriptional regulator